MMASEEIPILAFAPAISFRWLHACFGTGVMASQRVSEIQPFRRDSIRWFSTPTNRTGSPSRGKTIICWPENEMKLLT